VDLLQLHDVSKRYAGGPWVLSNVDMDVPEGESVSVLGSNGSGKSTLLRMLAGVSRPTRGRVEGRPEIVGYVPDRFPAFDAMNSMAYLVHIGRIRGLDTGTAQRRGQDLLERLQLVGGIRTPIRALSKGNAQKVALSQALMVPPRLLVLDEPWSGLDAGAHEVLADIIDEVVRAGGTVVFTDHRESVSRSYATLTYRIDKGHLEPEARTERTSRVPVVHVVLADPGPEYEAPRRIDWYQVDGVLGVADGEDHVRVQVRADAGDELLMIALRGGWSVAEVRRGGPVAGQDRGRDAWAR
jgi:ABC-type multidrug transport system ATPase subunit